MTDNKYVLAMYDIRSKQAFIYSSNTIKEIAGGSKLIRDCFSTYLFDAAKTDGISDKGLFYSKRENNVDFTPESFKQHLEEGYIGEVIYDGGGNFLVIYRDLAAYKAVNYQFSKTILKEIGTLQVLPTYIECLDFDDYKGDRDRLYAQHTIEEGRQSFMSPCGTLPIVQVDYASSEPLVAKMFGKDDSEIPEKKVSAESKAKYDKYNMDPDDRYNIKILDEIVEKRGEESLLAVIYADGNNMGYKVEQCIKGMRSYKECIHALREFSEKIQQDYIDDRKTDIDNMLFAKYGEKGKRRFVIGSGDEITFICNARHAYDVMYTYLKGLPEDCSACIGAAVFHSHAPYSEAYRIAEECCESGKKFMKSNDILGNACYMDFHYCQGAIGFSLEDIRNEEVGDLISKPWLVLKDNTDDKAVEAGGITSEEVERCRNVLNIIGRSNVKGLAEAAKSGHTEFTLELKRIRAHMKDEKRKSIREEDWHFLAENPALVYDMVTVFDIWFDEKRKGTK